MLRTQLANPVALPAVACHLPVLSVQNIFIAADTDSRTTTMQRCSQTIHNAECKQLELFVMTSEYYLTFV
jgi:NAD-dependent oxidoreductase involved in siderophore biosynthesis